MRHTIDTTITKENISLVPATIEEEIIQNLYFLYSSLEYDIPLDRALGLNAIYIDKPIKAAKALITTDIYDKTTAYEPRAKIVKIDFKTDYERGVLKPIVEVDIDGEYNKKYTK